MSFKCQLENGLRFMIENDGAQTFVSFSREGEGSRTTQSTGFTTGEWRRKPRVFQLEKKLIVRLETNSGTTFFQAEGNLTTRLYREPELAGAKEIELQESAASVERMSPMKPMEAMRPLQPMKSLSSPV